MRNRKFDSAVKNVKKLQAIIDQTERPDYKLHRDLAKAQAFLETVKVGDKAKRKEKVAEKIRPQLVEAEKEADQALKASNKAKRAARRAKKTAKESRQKLRPLREEHASKSVLETAESREEEDRLAFRNGEDADIAAEKQLYDANARVWALQRRLAQQAQDSQDSK